MRRMVLHLTLVFFAFITLVPFAYMTIASLKDNRGNSSGLFIPHEPTRAVEFKPADIDVARDTIKPLVKAGGPMDPGETLIYQGGTSTGLTDGRIYYAVPLPGGRIKLMESAGDARRAGAAVEEVLKAKKKADELDAAVDAALQGVKFTDITAAGTDKDMQFTSPWHILWRTFTLDNYANLFHRENIHAQIVNSFFFASMTSLLATLISAMGGYALAKFQFAGRRFLTSLVLAALIIPATMLIAPAYQLVFHFGLLDTLRGLILPMAGPAFLVFLFRQAMISSVPSELLEAGRIDGCGEIRMFFTIVLPLVRPMVSASLLITFIGSWNNFISPQVILQSPENFTLSVAVAQLKDVYSQDYGMLMAGTMISVLPVMILFLLLQKEFIAGLTAGAVKG